MKMHILKQTAAEYELLPRVVRAGRETEFTLRGLGIERAFSPGEAFTVRVIPQEQIATARTLKIGDEGCYGEVKVTAGADRRVRFRLTLPREQIYTLRLLDAEGERLGDLKVFAALEDLWRRSPMRGNTHCHVCFSDDGSEDPVVAASVYRKAGYDYLAITDHHLVDGSVFAMEHTADLPTELALYYGEEVHVPNAYIHAVNVGARMEGGEGLDVYYQNHRAEVERQVDAMAEEARRTLPPGLEPYDYAWRRWIADTIHSRGGIAIVAHPFWEYDANNTSNDMLRYLMETKLFDAVEVVHGQDNLDSMESNRQIAFWNEFRAAGGFFPVVGCDDAHRRSFDEDAQDCSRCFNHAWTVVFALDPSFEGFREAILDGYSVAAETYADAPVHVTGTYRLTNYALFLLREYYPLHDELCFEEGRALKDAYLGDGEAKAVLEAICGRVKRYTDRFFGRLEGEGT